MPIQRTYAKGYAGGVVTPEFFGRVDDTKYQTGLRTCRNFVVKPHGPVEKRGGTQFVRAVKDQTKFTRLLRFVFANDQSVVIECGAGYFRFHTLGATILSGGVPYEIANPYAEADLATINFVQSNDVVTLTHPKYPPAELKRVSATSWSYAAISFASTVSPPTNVSATPTPATTSPGTPTLQAYTVTAVNGTDESVEAGGSLTGSVQILSATKANPGVFTAGFSVAFSVGAKVFMSALGGMSQLNDKYYKIDTLTLTPPETVFDAELGIFVEISPGSIEFTLEDEGTAVPIDTTSFGTYTGGGTISLVGAARCSNNLFDTGAYNTIAWTAAPGAQRYNVYKLANGLYGYIGQTEQLSFTDDNIAADISKTPPIANNPFDRNGEYPAAVGYFEQRRCFAGTINRPANFWATRSGSETSLAYSIPSRDDDGIEFKIAARERNSIRHIVPMAALILLSESAEWRVSPAAGEVLTPDVSVRTQSFIGSSTAQPILVNNNLLFAAARGGHVRELAFNFDAQGYVTGDLSLRAPHLFDGLTIRDTAYTKAPSPIAWFVSSSGSLLGFTYVPEQQIGAWHEHTTAGGVFESVCSVPEGEDDVLYVVVLRQFASGPKRYIERLVPVTSARNTLDDADVFYVDCGMTYSGAPATTISGLTWLEGETVVALADGAEIAPQVVTGGAISVPEAASKVTVGLPLTADLETLPLAIEIAGYGQGREKNVNHVWVKVNNTRGLFAGATFDKLTEYRPRRTEPLGTPNTPRSDEFKITVSGQWNSEGGLVVRHPHPLPCTIMAHTIEFAIGG